MHYIYVIKNRKSLYIGYTKEIDNRLKQHKSTDDVELVYYEAYKYEKDARDRERNLKMYGSAWRGLKKRLRISLKETA